MNLFLTRLDEQQRRWYVALEAKKLGRGGATRMAQITGMDVRVRLPGGGRYPVEKKHQASKRR